MEPIKFEDRDELDAFLHYIEHDFLSCPRGQAILHADSDLGFWGSEDDLFDDCSLMMLAEVNAFALGIGMDWNWCRLADIQLSTVWHAIYDQARFKSRRRLGGALVAIGEEAGNENLINDGLVYQSMPFRGFGSEPPAQMIFEDIEQQGRIPGE